VLLRRSTWFATVLAAVVMVVATVSAASANQYPPAGAFGVACTVEGATVVCEVSGAQPGEQLVATAICDGAVRHNMTLIADEAGEASFTFVARGETCEVSVLGAVSGQAGVTVGGSADGEPVGAAVTGSGGGQLPFTGGEVGALLVVGILLIAGGLVALRRREDARVSATA
jgi:LPXTG-motif cell wall-anchored protein